MAKATGNRVNNWTQLGSTSQFLKEFEGITGIPVMVSNPGGTPETTGTWAIEEVAIDFAAWCSTGFRIWISQQIRTLMTEGTVSIIGNPITETKPELTPAKLDLLRSALFSLSTPLVDGFLLNCVQGRHPELKPEIDAAHSLLAATNPIPEILLTPTAIGERLGVKARTVNILLTEHGYQMKNPSKGKTEPAYLPTEKGKPYSSNTLATGRGVDNTSYQHTKWNESGMSLE